MVTIVLLHVFHIYCKHRDQLQLFADNMTCTCVYLSSGLYMQQVDAGGNDQVVGVAPTYGTYCLKSTIASAYRGVGSLSWSSLSRTMGYYSCGPLYGCWGVDRSNQVYVTQVGHCNL